MSQSRPAAVVVLALLSMTVGNLVALRQRRMVRLLAWSSIAQAGYILAALAVPDGAATAFTYAVFYVVLELGAFAAVIRVRCLSTRTSGLSWVRVCSALSTFAVPTSAGSFHFGSIQRA